VVRTGIGVVRGQVALVDWSVAVRRVGVGMTIGADPSRSAVDRPVRDPVAPTKSGTVAFASGASPILGTAVAARAGDRGEAGAAIGVAHVDPWPVGAPAFVAGLAVATQHIVAMDEVESRWPSRSLAERNVVGTEEECAVAVGAEIDVVIGIIRVVLVRRGVAGREG
jgi:hypothetical protein